MPDDLKSLNRSRKEDFRKSEEEESFLEELNRYLREKEVREYGDYTIEHPFLFVIGPPRSGTTLLSQVLAHCLDVGYINNLAARFWKAPVTGIRLAETVLDTGSPFSFSSMFGSTENLRDIHEFGYFWRDWLKKESFENIKNARQIEDEIDWNGLRTTLANIQAEFGRPMLFKNIFGSYHISKLNKVLGQTLWIYIERDPLDTAVSILRARKKYYDDLNNWWSYLPPEYEKIIDLDYWHQIGGQVHYLKKFYSRELDQLDETGRGLRFSLRDLCHDPRSILDTVQSKISNLYDIEIEIIQEPPESFEYHSYDEYTEQKERFRKILKEFQSDG